MNNTQRGAKASPKAQVSKQTLQIALAAMNNHLDDAQRFMRHVGVLTEGDVANPVFLRAQERAHLISEARTEIIRQLEGLDGPPF